MTATPRHDDPDRPGPIIRAYAATIVGLRHIVVLAWIAAAVAISIALPSLDSAPAAPLEDLAAKGGASGSATQLAVKRFGYPLATDTAVVQRDPRGLPPGTRERQLSAVRTVADRRDPALGAIRAAVPIDDSVTAKGRARGHATTAVTYLYFDPSSSLDTQSQAAQRFANRELGGRRYAVVGVTGAGPAREAQFKAIEDALPIIELASIGLIALIVGIAFRSLGAPLVTLGAAGIAFLITIRVLPWLGERAGVSVPKEIEPVVIVLLLGLVTDYSVFFLSAARRHLTLGEPRRVAARGAITEVAPSVWTAGLIVAAGTASLLVGRLEFFRAFGPGLAATTLVSLLVAVTLVPALVALFGTRLFGRSVRREAAAAYESAGAATPTTEEPPPLKGDPDAPQSGLLARLRLAATRPATAVRRVDELAREHQTSRWRIFVARVASSRPLALPIALAAIAVLALGAVQLGQAALGLSFVRSLPADSSVRQAAEAATKGFAAGIVSPTEVDVVAPAIAARRDRLARLEGLVARQHGVAGVLGPREQLPPPVPQALVARDDGAARMAVIFDRDPLGAPAIDRLHNLRDRMPALLAQAGLGRAQVAFGGETALADETVNRVLDDLWRVGLVALLINVVLLALFMRAIVAPLYLVAASLLGLAAALGLTALVFQGLLGYDDLTYYVPFAASVLLVALGSDYNVFIAGRIWNQARSMRLREAIAVAAPEAAKAIRVAGVALAASFALLALVPVRSFREFAFVMAAGVLIDTFIVRSLLVPALTSLAGERAWWPGRRVRRLDDDEFAQLVGARAGLERDRAERAAQAVLVTLAERITRRERKVLAAQLPAAMARAMRGADTKPERFDADEFLRRVSDREAATGADALDHTRAVLATLDEIVAGGLAYVRPQLTADYEPLLEPVGEPTPA
jgi:putative drug exporter of the RND superfamily